MPFDDLSMVYDTYQPDYLFTILTNNRRAFDPKEYLANLSELFPNTEILVSGSQIIGEDLGLPDNVIEVANPNRILEFISAHQYESVSK